MRIKRPLLAFFVALALLTAGGLYIASQSDAHGWHWTKCRDGGARWIRGHNGVNWYGPFWNCSGYWSQWEYYYTTKVWP